jgi:hypothetical protein
MVLLEKPRLRMDACEALADTGRWTLRCKRPTVSSKQGYRERYAGIPDRAVRRSPEAPDRPARGSSVGPVPRRNRGPVTADVEPEWVHCPTPSLTPQEQSPGSWGPLASSVDGDVDARGICVPACRPDRHPAGRLGDLPLVAIVPQAKETCQAKNRQQRLAPRATGPQWPSPNLPAAPLQCQEETRSENPMPRWLLGGPRRARE